MADLRLLMDIYAKDRASQVLAQVGNASAKAGDQAKHHGDQLESASARGRKSLGLLAGVITSSSAGALGPLQEVANKFQVIDQASQAATSKIGGRLLGVGAAALGASAFLQSLASREQEAQQRLQAAIEASGKDYADFADGIGLATKAGEHFGYQNSQTLDALNRLTITTHNPAEALKDLGVAEDVAAEKHIDLAKAAEVVGLTYNGSTRAGKQFGLHLIDLKKTTQELTSAQHNLASANERVSSTQQTYSERLAEYQASSKHTLAQQYALYHAYQDSVKAQNADRAAKARLKEAQEAANKATNAGAQNVASLAKVVHGQGEASADSFSGHLRSLGAQIEDTASKFGKDYGSGIQTASLATLAIGTVVESGLIPKLRSLITRSKTTGAALNALADVEVASSARGAVAIEANAAAGSAAMAEEATVAEASAGRIGTALAGIGAGLSSLALLGPGLFPDMKQVSIKGLSPAAVKAMGSGSIKGLSPNDQQALQTYLAGQSNLIKPQRDALSALNATLPDPTGPSDAAVMGSLRAQATAARLHPHGPTRRPPGGGPAPIPTQSEAAFLASLGGLGGGSGGGGGGKAASNALKAQISIDKALIASDKAAIASTQKRAAAIQATLATYQAYGKGISDNAHAFTDVLSSFPQTSNRNIGGLLNGLGSQLGMEGRFTSEIASLAKRGLRKSLIEELIEAGPSQIGLVDALYKATGSQLGTVNADIARGDAGAAALAKLGISTKFGATAESRALAEAKHQSALLARQEARLASIDHNIAVLDQTLANASRKTAVAATARKRKG